MRRRLALGCYLVLLVAAGITGMYLLHSPSPFLLGGLIGGAGFSLIFGAPWRFPEPARNLGIALIGVGAGALMNTDVLRRIVASPVEIIGGVALTLVLTAATGLVLWWSPMVNIPTAIFSSLAGAASGVSAIARELDADEAIVAAVQYARVVVVVVSVAFVAPLLGGAEPPPAPGAAGTADSLPLDLLFTLVCVGGGLLLARLARFSGSRLVVPLLLSMVVALAVPASLSVPAPLLNLGYGLTGLAVGFSFTPATMRLLLRLFPLAVLQLLLSVGGCAVVSVVFARMVGISDLAGYLALTPGGLPAVAAVAVESGTDVGLVVTMQVVRVLASILVASALGAAFKRRAHQRAHRPADRSVLPGSSEN